MPLNIKNERTHALAKELAELTNTSITNAVTAALQDAVERRKTRKLRNRNALLKNCRISPNSPQPFRSTTNAVQMKFSATMRGGSQSNGHRYLSCSCGFAKRART
ncbi:MAG: type II toxin-antitoxin system VapB family antitoxin [Spirochaetia bacterium]|nr:type II toxin-antitoxin system VapB family antitoxin [Spirochaetia bacterium]